MNEPRTYVNVHIHPDQKFECRPLDDACSVVDIGGRCILFIYGPRHLERTTQIVDLLKNRSHE